MKKYPEFNGQIKASEFFDFCSTLSREGSKEYDLEDLHIRVNKNFPKGADHGSEIHTVWHSARNNLDRIQDLNRTGIKKFASRHPITAGIVGTVIGGVIVLCFDKLVFDYSRSNSQEQSSQHIQNTPQEITP